MSICSAQLTAQIQIPVDKIPHYRARSGEADFAERLSADLASIIFLNPLQRQSTLNKAPIILNVDYLDAPDDLFFQITPNEDQGPGLTQTSADGAVGDDASSKQHLSDVQVVDFPRPDNESNLLDATSYLELALL